MPGHIVSIPETIHRCADRPPAIAYVPATVWECDVCHQQWVVVSGPGEDNRGYSAWRKLTDANKGGEDN